MCFCEEVVGIHTCCQHGCQRTSCLIRFNCSCQNDHICLDVQLFVGEQIRSLNHQRTICLRRNLADHTLNIVYAVLFYCTPIEFIVVLARCTNVNIEYINVGIRILFTAQHCVLCRIHTANLRAVFLTAAAMGCIAGLSAADTLYKYQSLRLLVVGKPFEVTFCRAICFQDTFKFQRSYNILALRISKFIITIQRNRIVTSCCNDCTILFFYNLIFLFIVDCTSRTESCTNAALALLNLVTVIAINDSNIRNCLCKRNVNCTVVLQTQVICTRYILNWALFGTDSTSGTLCFVNIPLLPANLHAEVADKAGDCFNFAVRINGNVFVLCTFYHLRS